MAGGGRSLPVPAVESRQITVDVTVLFADLRGSPSVW